MKHGQGVLCHVDGSIYKALAAKFAGLCVWRGADGGGRLETSALLRGLLPLRLQARPAPDVQQQTLHSAASSWQQSAAL
eukprot:15449250-Alexandrium_andersonii.AAC.1